MSTAVFGLAASESVANTVVERLKASGFSDNDISVLFPDKSTTRDFAHEKNTKAPEGATIGAGTGGVVGGTLGLLAGIGLLAIPGVGPFIAAGPIVAALSGIAVGAAAGGITGALIGMGIPEIEAKRYEGKVKDGNILISVHTDDGAQITEAKRLLEAAGATDISTATEATAPGAKATPIRPNSMNEAKGNTFSDTRVGSGESSPRTPTPDTRTGL